MADGDVTLLLSRLRSYSAALDRHTLAVQRAYDKAQESYTHLRRMWGGDAAQEFYEHWDRTTEAFERYLNGARRIKETLDARIESLSEADQPMGEGSGAGPASGSAGVPVMGTSEPVADQTGAERARADTDALRALAAYRKRESMPPAGPDEADYTAARLDVPGATPLYGKNAHGREITMRVNRYTKFHAEGDVFQQALTKELHADQAVLYVDRPLCDACGRYGGIGSLLRQTGIRAVEIVAPDGRFRITADKPSVPVRIGEAP